MSGSYGCWGRGLNFVVSDENCMPMKRGLAGTSCFNMCVARNVLAFVSPVICPTALSLRSV